MAGVSEAYLQSLAQDQPAAAAAIRASIGQPRGYTLTSSTANYMPSSTSMTPWGVQVGTGERAIAGQGARQYAGQEYVGGVGLTGGGYNQSTGYYQTPEDTWTQLQAKVGLNQPGTNPYLSQATGLPVRGSQSAGINPWLQPTNANFEPQYTMQPRQGESINVTGYEGDRQGMTYEQAVAEAARTGGDVAPGVNGWIVVPKGQGQYLSTTTLPSGSELQAGTKLPLGYQMISPPPSSPKKTPEQEYFEALQKEYVTPPKAKTTPSSGADNLGTSGEQGQPPQLVEVNGVKGYWTYSSDAMGNMVPKFNPVTPPITQVSPKPVPVDEGRTYEDKYGNVYQVNYNLNAQTGEWDRQADALLYKAPTPPSALETAMFEEQKRATAAKEATDKEKTAREQSQQEYQNQLAIMQMMQQRQQTMAQTNLQYQMQQQQLAAEKEQRLAELAANPASWLEYASLSGQPAKVQPWMLPLGYQQYGYQIGQEIPSTAGATSMAGLPELTTPSTQYLARMSPSQRQQYYGYQKAKKGLTPSDTEYYLWSQVPRGGGIRGLSYQR